MNHLGTVSSEGGPLLLADAQAVGGWQGSGDNINDLDDSDYGRACAKWGESGTFEGMEIGFDGGAGVLWNMEGTADIYANAAGRLCIVQACTDTTDNEADDMATLSSLMEKPLNNPVRIGALSVPSGVLALLWSPESGQCVTPDDIASLGADAWTEPTGETSMNGSTLIGRISPGQCDCWHDEVENEWGESARRCHLFAMQNGQPNRLDSVLSRHTAPFEWTK